VSHIGLLEILESTYSWPTVEMGMNLSWSVWSQIVTTANSCEKFFLLSDFLVEVQLFRMYLFLGFILELDDPTRSTLSNDTASGDNGLLNAFSYVFTS